MLWFMSSKKKKKKKKNLCGLYIWKWCCINYIFFNTRWNFLYFKISQFCSEIHIQWLMLENIFCYFIYIAKGKIKWYLNYIWREQWNNLKVQTTIEKQNPTSIIKSTFPGKPENLVKFALLYLEEFIPFLPPKGNPWCSNMCSN